MSACPIVIFAAMNRIEVRFYRGSSDVALLRCGRLPGSVDPEADFSFGKLRPHPSAHGFLAGGA